MDITNFITWFISQVVSIFSKVFEILDSITFSGTSLLKFSVALVVITALIPVILTIGKTSSVVASRSEKVKSNSKSGKDDYND